MDRLTDRQTDRQTDSHTAGKAEERKQKEIQSGEAVQNLLFTWVYPTGFQAFAGVKDRKHIWILWPKDQGMTRVAEMRQSSAATGGEGWESFFRGAIQKKPLKMLPAEVDGHTVHVALEYIVFSCQEQNLYFVVEQF